MGGFSREREISLKTGSAVLEALKRSGYNAAGIDCGADLMEVLGAENIDVAFIALHGPYGEDGCIQGVLEWLRIPYTGSGVLASALAMDKAVLNHLGRDLGLHIPKEIVFDCRYETLPAFLKRLHQEFGLAIRQPKSENVGFPVIVKPSREGSSINASIVRELSNLETAMTQALQSDCKVLVQEFISGKEITVAVLNGKALPSIEIVPKSGFYNFQSKYTQGATDYLLPARVSKVCLEKLRDISENVFRAIDCKGVARVDFIVNPVAEEPYFLEINTIPGMTETSLVPKAAAHAGISFEALCETILEGAGLQNSATNI